MAKKSKVVGIVAVQRDGTKLTIGDEVETDFDSHCAGIIFVVEKITEYPLCESGFLVVVHVKGKPERRMIGLRTGPLVHFPEGIDCNWMKLIKK